MGQVTSMKSQTEETSGVKEKVQEAAEKVPEMIRKYPVPSLLIGFGVGFLAAMAFHGRK